MGRIVREEIQGDPLPLLLAWCAWLFALAVVASVVLQSCVGDEPEPAPEPELVRCSTDSDCEPPLACLYVYEVISADDEATERGGFPTPYCVPVDPRSP